ncbi:MAG: hypothetical protein CM15mP95_2770 [Alphaproteobacteria bacterium]|nr:MAG: hypothetical protein CM15mP95_2770 [Alphaproteobacteria bacterium]
MFSYAIAITGILKQLATWVGAQEMTALTLMLLIGVVYLLMGCNIDSIGMMVITVPLLLPIVEAYGIDTVLFGIMVVLYIEVGLITPPIGLNLFVIMFSTNRKTADSYQGCGTICFLDDCYGHHRLDFSTSGFVLPSKCNFKVYPMTALVIYFQDFLSAFSS